MTVFRVGQRIRLHPGRAVAGAPVRQGAATGRGRLGLTDALQRARTAAEAVLDEHPDANVEITWRVVE